MADLFSGCNSSNTCNLGNCIAQIKGLSSNSASPSDTWIWIMKPNIRYQGVTIPSSFLKLYITPSSWEDERKRLHIPSPKVQKNNLIGMDYEGKIYMKIIKPLLDYHVSPHFIRPFAHTENCNFDDLAQLLVGRIPGDVQAQLERNLYIIFYQLSKRPAISDTTKYLPLIPQPNMPIPRFNNLRFGYILNEAIDSKTTLTLFDTLQNMIQAQPFNRVTFFTLLFQIAQAVYALFLSNTIHNDLHSGNAWVVSHRNTQTNIVYKINDKSYFFEAVTVKVKLYDFDRAYSMRLGENKVLDEFSCEHGGQCNAIPPVKDLAKIICYLLPLIKTVDESERINRAGTDSTLFNTLLSTFVPSKVLPEWTATYLKLHNCFLSINGKHLPSSIFKQLRSYPEILDRIYYAYTMAFKQAKNRDINISSTPVQRFNMNAKMFVNGVLIPPPAQPQFPAQLLPPNIAPIPLPQKRPIPPPARQPLPPPHRFIASQPRKQPPQEKKANQPLRPPPQQIQHIPQRRLSGRRRAFARRITPSELKRQQQLARNSDVKMELTNPLVGADYMELTNPII